MSAKRSVEITARLEWLVENYLLELHHSLPLAAIKLAPAAGDLLGLAALRARGGARSDRGDRSAAAQIRSAESEAPGITRRET